MSLSVGMKRNAIDATNDDGQAEAEVKSKRYRQANNLHDYSKEKPNDESIDDESISLANCDGSYTVRPSSDTIHSRGAAKAETLKRLKKCGSNIDECTKILMEEKIVNVPLSSTDTLASPNDCKFVRNNAISALYESCFLAALQVCMTASKKLKRKVQKTTTIKNTVSVQTDDSTDHERTRMRPLNECESYSCIRNEHERRNFIAYYSRNLCDFCPAVSCYSKCISIYGMLGNCDDAVALYNQQRKQLYPSTEVVNDFTLPNCEDSQKGKDRTILLHAVLAACVPTCQWKIALDILLAEITSDSPAVTVSACNIVLNAMCIGDEGIEAHTLLQKMMSLGQQSTSEDERTNTHKWPQPDKSSFLYVVNALVNQQILSSKFSDNEENSTKMSTSTSTIPDQLKYIDTAFRLLNTLMIWKFETSISSYLDVLSKGYCRCKCGIMVDYIDSQLRGKSIKPIPDPDEIRSEHADCDKNNSTSLTALNPSFIPWTHGTEMNHRGLVKRGRGRFAYWAYASYCDRSREITVAIKPNTDPSQNGIRILLYENIKNNDGVNNGKKDKAKKVGYLLLLNSEMDKASVSQQETTLDGDRAESWCGKSTFLGMYLDPSVRKEKLSKVFLSLWLDLCMKAKLIPCTGIINKPLLALLLQDTFSFYPTGGFDVEITKKMQRITEEKDIITNTSQADSVLDDSVVELQSPDASKSLIGGAIATSDIKRQHIRLVATTPKGDQTPSIETHVPSGIEGRNRIVRLNSAFHLTPLTLASLREKINIHLRGASGMGKLEYYHERDNLVMPWTQMLLGR